LYCLALLYRTQDLEPKLLAINIFRVYITEPVIAAFQKQKTTVSIIPGSCTGFIQILDIVLNQLLKKFIKEEADIYYNQNIKE
jgi:uncharacterized membrane protein (DUF485 family)